MKSKAISLTFILSALFCGGAANAAVIMTLEQVGSNVVATGTGTLNVAVLSFSGNGGLTPEIVPFDALLLEGGGGFYDTYSGISGPATFGSGSQTFVSSSTGNPLAVVGAGNYIDVLHGYVSGAPLSSTATWDNTTLAHLGVTTGTYTWTWGSGANADSLTLYAGVPAPTPVPEPASALELTLGAAGLALFIALRHN